MLCRYIILWLNIIEDILSAYVSLSSIDIFSIFIRIKFICFFPSFVGGLYSMAITGGEAMLQPFLNMSNYHLKYFEEGVLTR